MEYAEWRKIAEKLTEVKLGEFELGLLYGLSINIEKIKLKNKKIQFNEDHETHDDGAA